MKIIIFDFDGVIHDTFELAYKINVDIFGENFTRDQYRDFFNGNIFEKTKTKDNDKFFEAQNEAFKYLKIDDGIRKNLEKLYESNSLFIISSNQKVALDIYFNNNNFINIFKEVLGSEMHQSKVEKFKYLFEKYNSSAEDCIFITDTLGDILEGNKVGVKTIAVDFGFHERHRLEKGNPFKIVSSFDEILEVINSI
ncbi:MAG: HAD hydrolase-like protein [Candidatus Falkowbacteria bacterium]